MSKNLPSIQTLFTDSWSLFVKNLLNLFIINLLGIAGFAVLAVIGLLILLISGVGIGVITAGFQSKDAALLNLLMEALPVIVFIGVLLVISIIMIDLFVQIGSILILNGPGQKVSFGNIFKSSFKFMVPLFFIGFLATLLVLGGVFLFIIPGIIMGFLFSFYPFELILGNKKGLDSLRSSFYLVKSNFWPLLLRFILIWVLSILINASLNDYPVVLFIVSNVFGWFTLCFTFILYKQLKSVSDDKQSKLIIPLILSLAGWVIIVVFGSFIARNLPDFLTKPTNTEQIYESDTKPPDIQDI